MSPINRTRLVLFAAALIMSFARAPGPARAESPEAPKLNKPVVVNGDKVEYFYDKKQAIGSGNVSITYDDVVLTCDKITVYLDTKDAIAEGNVKVTQGSNYFTGDRMNYNFETKKGTVLGAYVSGPPAYGKAMEAEKVAGKDQLNLKKGYATTCDLDKPHYRIEAREVQIYFDDKVIARHIVAYAGDVPVFYLPYYVQSLRERKSHITVVPGQGKEWGYYLLSAYRYHFSDNNRADILLDYRTKKGLAEGINDYYNLKEIGDGAFKVYYTDEGKFVYDREENEKYTRRYRYQFRHRWEFGEDLETLALVEINKLSDPDIIKDYFYNEYQEIGSTPDNYVSFLSRRDNFSMEFLLRKRMDKFYTVVERLPEYRIDINSWKIGDTSLYYNMSTQGAYLNKTFQKIDPENKDINSIRADTFHQISYMAKLFKSLSVTPHAGIEETYYSRNKWGDTNVFRTVYKYGIDNQIKFYRVFDVDTNVMGLDINKLRHVITPTANYYYTPQPTVSADNLMQFDGIDSIERQNGIVFGLENKLQTKRREGESMKSVDIARLMVSSDYAFRLKKRSMATSTEKFKTVDFTLEVVPYSWMYLQSKMTVDTKRLADQTESTDIVMDMGERWRLAVSHRYENTVSDKSNFGAFEAMYRINDKWQARVYTRFNIIKGSYEEQEYTLTRDLHCWIGEFTTNIKRDGNFTFWFMARLKAFPEYPIGFKQTYSRPRFGNTGQAPSPQY